MIHILGSPRTGSTLLYQIIVNHFHVNYFANDGTLHNTDSGPVPYASMYGKTKEAHEPSEASAVLRYWWGEDCTPIPNVEKRMVTLLQAAEPVVFKNIWNVYRITEWARMFPDVQFVWIQRDIQDAGASDLCQRRKRGGGLNGAYLRFGRDLSNLPDHVQVYEQQLEINKTIEAGLQGCDYIQVQYSDLCNRTEWELVRLRSFLRAAYRIGRSAPKLVEHVR